MSVYKSLVFVFSPFVQSSRISSFRYLLILFVLIMQISLASQIALSKFSPLILLTLSNHYNLAVCLITLRPPPPPRGRIMTYTALNRNNRD
jgi:hypothetical protein